MFLSRFSLSWENIPQTPILIIEALYVALTRESRGSEDLHRGHAEGRREEAGACQGQDVRQCTAKGTLGGAMPEETKYLLIST